MTSRCIGSLCSTHFREHSFAALLFFFDQLFVSYTRPLDGSLETVLFPGNIPSFLATEARDARPLRETPRHEMVSSVDTSSIKSEMADLAGDMLFRAISKITCRTCLRWFRAKCLREVLPKFKFDRNYNGVT